MWVGMAEQKSAIPATSRRLLEPGGQALMRAHGTHMVPTRVIAIGGFVGLMGAGGIGGRAITVNDRHPDKHDSENAVEQVGQIAGDEVHDFLLMSPVNDSQVRSLGTHNGTVHEHVDK